MSRWSRGTHDVGLRKGREGGAADTVGEGRVIRVCLQNLLGLRDTPRQFFLQVYHILRSASAGDIRYLPPQERALPSRPRPAPPLPRPGPFASSWGLAAQRGGRGGGWEQLRWERVRIPGSLRAQTGRVSHGHRPGVPVPVEACSG